MSVYTINGLVVAPTAADAYGVPGYDNAGLFGPQFANLGGDRFTLSWLLGPQTSPIGGYNGSGPILDVSLTINGITWDMGAVPAGDQIMGGGQWDTINGQLTYLTFGASLSTIPGPFVSSTPLALYNAQFFPLISGLTNTAGSASLEVRGHEFNTVVGLAVPLSDLGTGWLGLALTAVVLAIGGGRRLRISPRPRLSPQ